MVWAQYVDKKNINGHETDGGAFYVLPDPTLNLYLGWVVFIIVYIILIGYGLPFFALKITVLLGGGKYVEFEFFAYLIVFFKLYLYAILAIFFIRHLLVSRVWQLHSKTLKL